MQTQTQPQPGGCHMPLGMQQVMLSMQQQHPSQHYVFVCVPQGGQVLSFDQAQAAAPNNEIFNHHRTAAASAGGCHDGQASGHTSIPAIRDVQNFGEMYAAASAPLQFMQSMHGISISTCMNMPQQQHQRFSTQHHPQNPGVIFVGQNDPVQTNSFQNASAHSQWIPTLVPSRDQDRSQQGLPHGMLPLVPNAQTLVAVQPIQTQPQILQLLGSSATCASIGQQPQSPYLGLTALSQNQTAHQQWGAIHTNVVAASHDRPPSGVPRQPSSSNHDVLSQVSVTFDHGNQHSQSERSQLACTVGSSENAVKTAHSRVPSLDGASWQANGPLPDDAEVTTVFPRRRAGQGPQANKSPVVLTKKQLRDLYVMPLRDAATKLGISVTALKNLCRKVGINKWPFRKVQSLRKKSMIAGRDVNAVASVLSAASQAAAADRDRHSTHNTVAQPVSAVIRSDKNAQKDPRAHSVDMLLN